VQTGPLDLLEIQVLVVHKVQRGIRDHEAHPVSLVLDPLDSMGSQGQTGFRVNWVKSDLLESEAREVKWVLQVLLVLGGPQESTRERSCAPWPAPPV